MTRVGGGERMVWCDFPNVFANFLLALCGPMA
jgi:hypothetical protein